MVNRIHEKKGRWIEQHVMYDEEKGVRGNCMQASVASILGLPLDEVPHFAETGDAGDVWDAFEEYLLGKGYCVHMLSKNSRPDGLYLATGKSLRGVSHMVVMHGDKVHHDPHPSKTGLIDIDFVYLLVPYDPILNRT